jgi:uncharacterized damage-inducible protein DinB
MDERLKPLYDVLSLNTRLFFSCLQDVDDAAAQKRMDAHANSAAFIAVHLVDARRFLAEYLGVPPQRLPAELLPEARSVEDVREYPTLDCLGETWRFVSVVLRERLSDLSGEELNAPSSRSFPIEDGSVLGGIAFMLQHESYHIGQLSLLRRLLGFPPMSYF